MTQPAFPGPNIATSATGQALAQGPPGTTGLQGPRGPSGPAGPPFGSWSQSVSAGGTIASTVSGAVAVITLTGSPGAPFTYTLPSGPGAYEVVNNSTQTATVTAPGAANSVTVASSASMWVATDGTSVFSGGAGVTSVSGSGVISSSGGATPVISSSALNALAAVAAGSTGTLTVTAPVVVNQPTTNNGVITVYRQVTTTGATPGTCDIVTPTGTAAIVDVLVIANNGTDAGAQRWSGKLMNVGGTVTVLKAFAAVDTWDASSGATTWSVSVAMSGVDVVATCTASSGAGTTNWTVLFQYASAAS